MATVLILYLIKKQIRLLPVNILQVVDPLCTLKIEIIIKPTYRNHVDELLTSHV